MKCTSRARSGSASSSSSSSADSPLTPGTNTRAPGKSASASRFISNVAASGGKPHAREAGRECRALRVARRDLVARDAVRPLDERAGEPHGVAKQRRRGEARRQRQQRRHADLPRRSSGRCTPSSTCRARQGVRSRPRARRRRRGAADCDRPTPPRTARDRSRPPARSRARCARGTRSSSAPACWRTTIVSRLVAHRRVGSPKLRVDDDEAERAVFFVVRVGDRA